MRPPISTSIIDRRPRSESKGSSPSGEDPNPLRNNVSKPRVKHIGRLLTHFISSGALSSAILLRPLIPTPPRWCQSHMEAGFCRIGFYHYARVIANELPQIPLKWPKCDINLIIIYRWYKHFAPSVDSSGSDLIRPHGPEKRAGCLFGPLVTFHTA